MKKRLIASIAAMSVCALTLLLLAGCSSASGSGSGTTGASSAESTTSAESAGSGAASAAGASAASAAVDASSAASSSASAKSAASSAQPASAESAGSAAATEASPGSSADSDDGLQHFTGTVLVLNCAELLELQDVDLDAGMFGENGEYAVLKLAEPADVTGMVADGTGPDTRTASILGIGEYTDFGNDVVVEYGDLDLWKQLEGQEIEIAAQVDDIYFPTDVSLPVGEPRINACEVV